MVGFIDRALLQLYSGSALTDLMKDGGPAPYQRLRRLVDTVFDPTAFADLDVTDVTMIKTRPLTRIASGQVITGSLVTTQPSFASSDLRGELRSPSGGEWAHLFATIRVATAVTLDPGGVDSALVEAIDNITSLDDFAGRFRYLDLPAFLSAHQITTVEQLRERAHYLRAEVRFKAPPALPAGDPGRRQDVDLDLAVVISDTLDLAGGLTAATRLRTAGAAGPPGPASPAFGKTSNPFALAVVFPRAALVPGEPTEDQIDGLYAAAGVLPLFASPP